MAKHFIAQANKFTSIKIEGSTVVITNEQNKHVIILSFKAFDEMTDIVNEEREVKDGATQTKG